MVSVSKCIAKQVSDKQYTKITHKLNHITVTKIPTCTTSKMDISASNYYGPHTTKQDYDCAFNQARLWALGEGLKEPPHTAATIFQVKKDAIYKSVYRTLRRQRNLHGLFNNWGSNNKILSPAQEAVRQYCYEKWEMGLGATHAMVFAAICHLKQV